MFKQAFSISRLPRIEFGPGAITRLPKLLAGYGQKVLLVTGARSLSQSEHWKPLQKAFKKQDLSWEQLTIDGEPSPEIIDQAVKQLQGANIQVVVGIGGGSVLDAAKAVAGLLPSGDSVMDYLEGVGAGRDYQGPALPCIAVPTTAGTGSEATKNAVLGVQGKKGYKKSFRHESLVPEYALIDPDLLATCPRPQIAANAMDALTQLIESYVSLNANPYTDALIESAVIAVRDGLFAWYDDTENAAMGRAQMAYAALISGVCLAQTGLGSVHGLAAPLGAFFPIPHGVVCGTLLAVATRTNIDALKDRAPDHPSRDKYAQLGNLLGGKVRKNPRNSRELLVMMLSDWIERVELPTLSHYGVREKDLERIVANARGNSMRTNPIELSDEELIATLRQRL